MLIKYLTIESGQTSSDVVKKFKRLYGSKNRYQTPLESDKLMGNQKIITLRPTNPNDQTIIKIDGPGQVIDDVWLWFNGFKNHVEE